MEKEEGKRPSDALGEGLDITIEGLAQTPEKHFTRKTKGVAPDRLKKFLWKKGESGNPAGRPKKENNLTSILKIEIDKIHPRDKERRTWKELIVIATMNLAMKGNPVAIREVWERMDGKVPLPLQGVAKGPPINITIAPAEHFVTEEDQGEDPEGLLCATTCHKFPALTHKGEQGEGGEPKVD